MEKNINNFGTLILFQTLNCLTLNWEKMKTDTPKPLTYSYGTVAIIYKTVQCLNISFSDTAKRTIVDVKFQYPKYL